MTNTTLHEKIVLGTAAAASALIAGSMALEASDPSLSICLRVLGVLGTYMAAYMCSQLPSTPIEHHSKTK